MVGGVGRSGHSYRPQRNLKSPAMCLSLYGAICPPLSCVYVVRFPFHATAAAVTIKGGGDDGQANGHCRALPRSN